MIPLSETGLGADVRLNVMIITVVIHRFLLDNGGGGDGGHGFLLSLVKVQFHFQHGQSISRRGKNRLID